MIIELTLQYILSYYLLLLTCVVKSLLFKRPSLNIGLYPVGWYHCVQKAKILEHKQNVKCTLTVSSLSK